MKAGESSNNQKKVSGVLISLQSGKRKGKSSSIAVWDYVKSVKEMESYLLASKSITLSPLAREVRMNFLTFSSSAFRAIAGKQLQSKLVNPVFENDFSNLIFPVDAQIIKQPIAERLEKSFTPPPFENFSHSGLFPKRFFSINSVSWF